jgi:glycosyltransferase involved in cell wall biosynthesis
VTGDTPAARPSVPAAPVMLDISRLIWRGRRTAPSGIDRVELAYAEYLLDSGGQRPAYAVIHLLGWVVGVSPAAARRFVRRLAARWRGETSGPRGRHASLLHLYGSLFRGIWRLGFQLRWHLRGYGAAPVFLVVSHHHLAIPRTMHRVKSFFGARCVCFVHDLLPLDHPEYFERGLVRGFQRLPVSIAASFDAVIANSEVTAVALRQVLTSMAAPHSVRIHVAPPGARAFPRPAPAAEPPFDADSVPYFIVLGTIEPRKNHLLLLNLWGQLATSLASPPRLFVIGARGWENANVVDLLERSGRLEGVVVEHNRLDDAAVGALMSHARAVLVPSFAEGFGLPLAEALASGVPVICSDIPVFREVGRGVPDYADPRDLDAWRDQVLEYMNADSIRRAAQLERLAHWRAPSWSDHFRIVEAVLDELADAPGGAR